MKKILSWISTNQIYIVNVAYLVFLLVVIAPLLLMAQYNYPSADDWSYGVTTRQAVQNGKGIVGVLQAAFRVMISNYTNWEGRFSNCFLASLQPGIWGERFYCITTWIMVIGLCVSTMVFFNVFLQRKENPNGKCLVAIVVPILMVQLLFVPYPDESLYWYTGAVNYTFMYALSLMLIAGGVWLSNVEKASKWTFSVVVVCCFIAIIVGGNNFATSMATLLTLLLVSYAKRKQRRNCLRLSFIMSCNGISMLFAIFSPANIVRVNANFQGETGGQLRRFLCLWLELQQIFSHGQILVL